MTVKTGWTRRAVLATKAAVSAVLALPATTASALGTGGAGAAPTAAGAARVLPARWPTATAAELGAYVGQRFRVSTKDHGTLVLRLTDVQSPAEDLDRPTHLQRRLGVSATFTGPDAELLAETGDGVHRISHPRIGAAEVYLKPLPGVTGGQQIEMILN